MSRPYEKTMNENSKLIIGITNTAKYPSYQKWIEEEAGVKVVCLTKENGLKEMENCDGVLLSGSVEDIHPRFYNKPEYLSLCDSPDERRDEFELQLIRKLRDRQTPILGICRGLQIVNVFFGGTLIPNITTSNLCVHPDNDEGDSFHPVEIQPGSMLDTMGLRNGIINSAHHQAADKTGSGLVANAFSPDGIVEGLELDSRQSPGYLLLVQWHPERLQEKESRFGNGIRQSFLNAAKQYQMERS